MVMDNINELISYSAILYCGIYNIYDKEKRILNKINKVIIDVFPPLLDQIKENCDKLDDLVVENYCNSIMENMKEIIEHVKTITFLGEEVVEKVRSDVSSVGLVFNDDLDNFDTYTDKQKKVVINFLKATQNNSIKAFKDTYSKKDLSFRYTKVNLQNIVTIVESMIKTKMVDQYVINILDKIKVDALELTQDIIDLGKPKERLLKKLKV